MKTIVRNFMRLFLLVGFVTSCETDIPTTDTETPGLYFQISGDGFSHSFNQDTDFSSFQLNLKANTLYEFVLIASDKGGVQRIQWQYTPDYTEFVDPIESPWTNREVSALSSIISWEGNRADPRTGATISGKLEFRGQNIGDTFKFSVSDFGGAHGAPNTFFVELSIFIGDHDTEIIEFNREM